MAKKSLSQQLAELREYTARIEGELAATRDMLATKSRVCEDMKAELAAATNRTKLQVKLAHHQPAARQAQPDLGKLARDYCAQHGVRSVTREQLLAWRR